MGREPLVSIIVPCYNHQFFLEDCLWGIENQTYRSIELFICDDCSTDGSYEIIKGHEDRLKDRFKRVVLMRNETNQGVTKNINKMLRLAKGELIKIIASDDVLAGDAIGKMAEEFIRNAEVDVLVANGVRISEEQHYPDFIPESGIYQNPPDFTSPDLFSRIFVCNEIFAPGVMVRKSVYDRYGFYDESIAIEDFEFWLRILKNGRTKISYIDQILVYYRVSSESMTAITDNIHLEQRRIRFHLAEMQTMDKYKEYVDESLYAETKLMRLLVEKFLSANKGLYGLEKIVREEMRNFTSWKALPVKRRVFFRVKFLETELKKHINLLKGNSIRRNVDAGRKKAKGC